MVRNDGEDGEVDEESEQVDHGLLRSVLGRQVSHVLVLSLEKDNL